MSLALLGLRTPRASRSRTRRCVAKTYPGYWDDLEKLRG